MLGKKRFFQDPYDIEWSKRDPWRKQCYDLDPRLPYGVKELYFGLVADPRFKQQSFAVARDLSSDDAWTVRRLAVERLQLDLDEELVRIDQLLRNDTTNFQKWYHRRWVVEKLGPSAASRELDFTEEMIHEDVNNSAAWSHRKWILQEFGGDFDHELEYCGKILGQDSSCSYAWEQRYFVATNIWDHLRAPREVKKVLSQWSTGKEVDYLLEFIVGEPDNVCPWTYIRRLHGDSLVDIQKIEAACVTVIQNETKNACVVNGVALIKKRGGLNAVQMIRHLLGNGLALSLELIEVIENLYRVLFD